MAKLPDLTAASLRTGIDVAEAAEIGLAAVRELDAIVRNIYRDNEAELAAWESASHVENAPRRAEEEESPAEPSPAQS